MDLHLLACPWRVRRLDRAAVNFDMALLDQALDGAARYGREFSAQEGIEPFRRQRFFDGENFSARAHKLRLKSVERS